MRSPENDSRKPYIVCMWVAVMFGTPEIDLFNVYIPPVVSCASSYSPDVGLIQQGNNHVVVGDFNVHHKL